MNKFLYAAVAHGRSILDETPSSGASYSQLVSQILESTDIDHQHEERLSYIYDDHLINYITCQPSSDYPEGLSFFVITLNDVPRKESFSTLLEIRKAFNEEHETSDDDFTKKLNDILSDANRGKLQPPTRQLQMELDKVKDIMVENIERVLDRGERINLLVDKTDRMNNKAATFRKRSTAVKRRMFFNKFRTTIVLVLVILVLLYFISVGVCGFPALNRCLNRHE